MSDNTRPDEQQTKLISARKTRTNRVVWARDSERHKAGDCTRCGVNLLDVPQGFYCGVCKWEAK